MSNTPNTIYKVTYGSMIRRVKHFMTLEEAQKWSSYMTDVCIKPCPQIMCVEAQKGRNGHWKEAIILLSKKTIRWRYKNSKTGELTAGYGKGEMRLTARNVYDAGVNSEGEFIIGTRNDNIAIRSNDKVPIEKHICEALKQTAYSTSAKARAIIEEAKAVCQA